MAHTEQRDFCIRMSTQFPKYFSGKKVLDIGSLDINGNNRFLFENCNYIGLDLGDGPNVDVVCQGNKYDAPDEVFDVIISTEVFEHDMYYADNIKNIIRMLKPGGAFIFTCASGQRPEHGTRRSSENDAPLLIHQSEEWSDYYKNLEESDFIAIPGFVQAFPDGIFELGAFSRFNHAQQSITNQNIHSDIYFFGVKGGIANDMLYAEPEITNPICAPNSYPDDIFVIDTWPNTKEKELSLVSCIKQLKQFGGIPILLVSHYPIKPEIQKLVDYYIFDKSNPLLLNSEFQKFKIYSGRWTMTDGYRADNEIKYHHDYAIWQSMRLAFNFCNNIGKKQIHFMEYDNELDLFQYSQAFIEKANEHDAIIYEYRKGSSSELSSYMATFLFSIKTDIALRVINSIHTRDEYFTKFPNGFQLEKMFLHFLQIESNDIYLSPYVDNNNGLNTQAVWNRDGILRYGAKFQIYPVADDFGNLLLHAISGFHETEADSDYLLEIRYGSLVKFEILQKNKYLLINLGKYSKGSTVYVNYLGCSVLSEFLADDYSDFIKMNSVSYLDKQPNINVRYNFVDGAYIELLTESNLTYTTVINNTATNIDEFIGQLRNSWWAKTSTQYFKPWNIQLLDQSGKKLVDLNYDATDQTVYIALESKALGDTIAWFPYVEEFRKTHNCKVICSTFWNNLFSENYPEITFIDPGKSVGQLYAMYRIGYYFNEDDTFDSTKHPFNPIAQPLQKTSSDILGLPYSELKPIISYPVKERKKKVGLGIHSTCQGKYWNNPIGWQIVTDWLLSNGYEPIIFSTEPDGYMGNRNPDRATQFPPGSIEKVIDELAECSAFIGISSGLTWLAWATNTPTIQISGYTEQFNEPTDGIIKISAQPNSCSGCANRLKLDQGDWNWCPDHKNTDRQFECSKLISPELVISELSKILI